MSDHEPAPAEEGDPDARADLSIAAEGWAEASGPGSLRGLWLKVSVKASLLGGLLAIGCGVSAGCGWIFGVPELSGAYFDVPPISGSTACLLVTTGLAVILVRPGRGGRFPSERAGRMLAAFSLLASALVFVNGIDSAVGPGWAGGGAWQQPTSGPVLTLMLLSLGILTVDSDPPRYRWTDVLIPVLAVMLLVNLLTLGYQLDLILGRMEPGFSVNLILATVGIYLGYFFLRPERGIPGFMLSVGPGPAMARFLAPTVLLLPTLISLPTLLEPAIDSSVAEGLGEILMLAFLLAVVAGTSRRLQRFYRAWRKAEGDRAERAAVLGSMSEGVAVLKDEDLRFVLTNPQFDAMYGWEAGEVVGRSYRICLPDDLTPVEWESWRRIRVDLDKEGRVRFEGRTVHRDGSVVWSRSNVSRAVHPEHGLVWIIVISDITAEYQARDAGAEALERFRQVFEQSPIGLCLVRPDGTFEQVNSAYEKITGYGEGELDHTSFAEITHPDDVEQDRRLSASLFNGEIDRFAREKRYIRKDGEVVWVDLTVARLRGPGGPAPTALSMVEDITDRHRLHQRLQHLVDHDALSGLYSRRRFRQELELSLGDSRDPDTPVSLLNIDLDNFKFVNDSFGHTVGDQLIVRAAEVLKNQLDENCILARPGGDEFAVLIPGTDGEAARPWAEDLASAISRETRVGVSDRNVRLTASIGIATARPGVETSAERILMEADIAMYDAKASGRNCVRLYDRSSDSEIAQSIDWHGRIGTALETGGFVLHAQPIHSLGGEAPDFHELLVRLLNEDGTLAMPGTFLPVAERHDLIQEIDRWVIREAIATLAVLGLDGTGQKLGVNLSGRSVGDPRLSGFIAGELEFRGVDPSSLVFEITETGAISDMTGARVLAKDLGRLGCGLALDDFGTGFASFYNLKHIDCDYLKIDGEFVDDLAGDTTNRVLVKSMIDVAHLMGKLIVAEGVTDDDSLDLLREFGVDFAQGYHLGRPVPLTEVFPQTAVGTGEAPA